MRHKQLHNRISEKKKQVFASNVLLKLLRDLLDSDTPLGVKISRTIHTAICALAQQHTITFLVQLVLELHKKAANLQSRINTIYH